MPPRDLLPDGKRVAFAGDSGPDSEIFTIRSGGGGGKLNVTDNATHESRPSYSSDGKRVAYDGYATRPQSDHEIHTVKAGGGGKSRVTNNATDDFAPSWGIARGCSSACWSKK